MKQRNQHKPVGLTGGIASGKSTVAAMFSSLGARAINTDSIAADVLKPGGAALNALVSEFGDRILDKSALDRSIMLDILLTDACAMQKQLDILRPFLLPEIDSVVHAEMTAHSEKIVIVEAPLLFEYGQPERYDPIIVVSIPERMQIERLMRRSGKDELWARAVVSLQWPLPEKEKHADYIIHNNLVPSETEKQVKHVYSELVKRFIR